MRRQSSFLTCCPALGLYSQGRTERTAKKAMASAIMSFFRCCYDRGTLNAVLKKRGFRAAESVEIDTTGLVTDQLGSGESFKLDVPIPLIAESQEKEQCLQ